MKFLKFIKCKSRFNFNISALRLCLSIFYYLFLYKKNYKNIVIQNLKNIYPEANFFFYDQGRTALYILLCTIRKTERKKILINSLTLFEMINMIIYAGYEPVFVDNLENSFKTNTLDLLDKYSNEVRAVVVTHLNGINNEIINVKDKVDNLNKKRESKDKILLIEDCAVSFSAMKNNKYCGSFGDFSILSFNIMKNITSMTGGVLVDNKKKLKFDEKYRGITNNNYLNLINKFFFILLIQILNSRIVFPLFFIFIRFSQKKKLTFFLKKYRTDYKVHKFDKIPENFLKNMSNFQFYLVKDQFENLSKNNNIRINNSQYIFDKIKKNKMLIFPQNKFNEENIFIDFPVICKHNQYKQLIWEKSLENFVDIKNYYYTNCQDENIYKEFNKSITNNSGLISDNIIMLPVGLKQNKNDLDKICDLFL